MYKLKLYRFIYYRLFKFFISISKRDMPERKALIFLALWDGLYLLIPYGLLRYFTNNSVHISNLVVIGIFLLIILLQFLSLIPGKRYLKIFREFENDEVYRKKYSMITPVIFLFPFLMMILLALIS
jgi:hypothetical protein